MYHSILPAIAGFPAAFPALSFSAAFAVSSFASRDPFFEANVEALSRFEGITFGPMCSQTGKAGDHYMKLCSNCSGNFGHYEMSYTAYCPR